MELRAHQSNKADCGSAPPRVPTKAPPDGCLATTIRVDSINRPTLYVGARLPENAYSRDNVLLLRAGAPITTDAQLFRLLLPDVRFGEYRPPEAPDDLVNEKELKGASATLRRRIKERDPEVRHAVALKREAINNVRSVFSRIEAMGQVDMALARNTVASIMGELAGANQALTSLVQLKDADAYTFSHSVNVCILAMYVAERLGGGLSLRDLGLGALLHDIGKLKTPPEVLQKPGPLDAIQTSVVRRHPTDGRKILLASECRDDILLGCVLDHHERISGRGYPLGKKAGGIGRCAQIVGLCDVFDALTTDRPYRPAMSTQAALALMGREMASDLDPELLSRFIEIVTPVVGEDEPPPDETEEDDDDQDEAVEIVPANTIGVDIYA